MRTRLVPIGNSRGLRIPKALLEACGITDAVELAVEGQRLVIRPLREPRAGWEEAAHLMAARGEDGLLDLEVPATFDDAEWEW